MTAMPATLYAPGYIVAGKYELEEQLGQGGMGVVWRARNVSLDSPVAIKVVRGTSDKAVLQGRLVQEARAAAKLTHPAIVKVFDVGQTESGDPFIVMELLLGDSLGKILEDEGRLPAVQAVRSLLPIADALWLAHSKGIVHRDLKPDNVFVVQQGGVIQPKLLDFGIVKIQGAEVESHLTKAGDVLGSPDYMSPEQARGLDDVGHLTDVWSFCVVLYESIAGQTPFKGANYNALLRQIVEDEPPTLRQLAAADEALSAIVARGLSKLPQERFASMGELGRALAQWLMQQGVGEDICGSTLEARWLRATDAHERAMRATLTSLSDAWSVESGSGVRRNELQPVHTLPAPAPAPQPDSGLSRGPSTRSRWQLVAASIALCVLALAGFMLGKRFVGQTPAAPSGAGPSRVGPPPPTTVQAEPRVAPGVAVEPPVLAEKRARLPAEPVSSAKGSVSTAAPARRPSPAPAKKKRAVSGKEKSTQDLLSPY